MARQTGVTTETANHMILDAGAVYLNYGETDERLFGATRDGSEFTIEHEIREIAVDGLRGPTVGYRRIVEEHARLTVNLLEMTAENIQAALAGSSVDPDDATTPTQNIVTRSLAMDDLSYITNVALVADYSGSGEPVVIILQNALSDGDFTLSATDREESVAEVQFTAHFDPTALDDSPYEIRFPVLA